MSDTVDWQENIGWIYITLFSDRKPVRRIKFEGKPLKLDVKSNDNFDIIEFEFLCGKAMLNSGISKEKILKKVAKFSKYDEIDVNIYFDNGTKKLECMTDSHELCDEYGEPDQRPWTDLSIYDEFNKEHVHHVIIKFKKPDE